MKARDVIARWFGGWGNNADWFPDADKLIAALDAAGYVIVPKDALLEVALDFKARCYPDHAPGEDGKP